MRQAVDDAFEYVNISEDDETNKTMRQGKYYYFIGRLNPPHEGHIAALLSVIRAAIADGGISIILLGSGPNGGTRTSKDPLNFDLKFQIVKQKLEEALKTEGYSEEAIQSMFEPNGQIKIFEMGKTVEQIREVIRKDIISNLFTQLNATRISGAKDGGEDIRKLAWIENALSAGIIDAEGNLIPITTKVIAEPAITTGDGNAMSATIIRNIIFNMDPSIHDKISHFKTETNNFYGELTRDVFGAIDTYNPSRVDEKNASATSAAKTQKRKGTEGTEGTEGTKSKLTKKGGSRKGPKRRKTKRRSRRTRQAKRRRSRRN